MVLEYDVRRQVASIAARESTNMTRARALLALSRELGGQARRLRNGCLLLDREDQDAAERLRKTMLTSEFLRESVRIAARQALRGDAIELPDGHEPLRGPNPFEPALPDPELRPAVVG